MEIDQRALGEQLGAFGVPSHWFLLDDGLLIDVLPLRTWVDVNPAAAIRLVS